MTLRRIFLFAVLSLSTVAIIFGVSTCTTKPTVPPAADLPSPFVIQVADDYHFLQIDPAWAGAEMGRSGGTLAEYGCTLTSVAMAAANLGVDTDPGALNAALSAVDGYTERGWLKWAAIEQATGGALSVTVYGEPSDQQIDECLQDGDYPIVKFFLDDRVQHWALVIGKTEQDWVVRDPLDDTRTLQLLGDLTSGYESVRCIRSAEGG